MVFKRGTQIRRTTFICILLASLLVGLFAAKFTEPISISWLILGLLLLPVILSRRAIIIVLYCVMIGLLGGWYRGGALQQHDKIYQNYYHKKVAITARATEDSVYGNRSQLTFAVENILLEDQKIPGKIKVSGFGEAMIYRHDVVSITGKLYPIRGGNQANISYAQIKVLARAKSPLEDFRRRFVAGMQNALPEPAASFAVGLLVGQRSLLPSDLLAVLTIVGLTHIVAVSGYNLTIIVRATTKLLKKFSKFQTLAVSFLLIYLFLLVTGFSPSIVRASIVSGLSLLAWYFGHQFRPLVLLLLAAAITGLYNPYYIWGDIGWYLSFFAFFGVLILAPLLTLRLKLKLPLLGDIAIESLSAQIMTLPLIMFIFGRVSVVGLLANIIIVPLVPFAMLFSLIAGLAGAVVPAVAGWLALPARIVLDFMLLAATWFSHWPSAQALASITAVGLVFLYLILAIFILGLKKHTENVKISKENKIG